MRPVLAVLGIVTGGFLAYGLAVESPFVWFYVTVTVLVTVALGLVHRSVGFPASLVWSLAAIAVGNLAGGVLLVEGNTLYVFRLGGLVPYDLLFHSLASMVGGWAAVVVVEVWHGRATSTVTAITVAVLVAAGAGAVVEIVEFTGTLLFPNTNVGDYRNNMLDLVANLAGAVGGAAIAALRRSVPGRSGARQSVARQSVAE